MATEDRNDCVMCPIVPLSMLEAISSATETPRIRRHAINTAKETIASCRELVGSLQQGLDLTDSNDSEPALHGFIPDSILQKLSQSSKVDQATRESYQRTLKMSEAVRQERASAVDDQDVPAGVTLAPGAKVRIHNLKNQGDAVNIARLRQLLSGAKLIRDEDDDPSIDTEPEMTVNECFANFKIVLEFFEKVFKRNSLDGKGTPLKGTVHWGNKIANAIWLADAGADGKSGQMVFGDGNLFLYDFTKCLDVIAHELGHGVIANSGPGLRYNGQSGALNESIADVVGSMVKQWWNGEQTAEQADWFVGEGCIFPGVRGQALRSLKAPGSAFNDPELGLKDNQPSHMDDFASTTADNGGVHVNSGIPNHAFYLASMYIGGKSWEKAGQVWYKSLSHKDMHYDCSFEEFATITVDIAENEFGNEVAGHIRKAWVDVGVLRA